jgi:hydrogenase expression/formation protein HypC
MCLAIPGKVLSAFDQNGLRMARVQFGGIVREACLEYVPETQVGEYVLVHVGFAISRVDEAEAERTYQALKELDQLTELEAPVVEEVEPAHGEEAPALPAWMIAEGARR